MTALQSTVRADLGFGMVGEVFLDGPVRAQPGIIDSVGTTPAFNRIGRAFTQVANSDGHCTIGGAVGDGTPFYGILSNPKVYPNRGTTGDTLAPSLDLPQYTQGEFIKSTSGMVVELSTAANVGDLVDFVNATGVLLARAPSAGLAGGNSNVPNARVERYDLSGSGLAVISLTN